MPKKSTRAYRAGQHVHNFFAVIGTTVGRAASAVANGVVDFGTGVKDGGTEKEIKAEKKRDAAQTA